MATPEFWKLASRPTLGGFLSRSSTGSSSPGSSATDKGPLGLTTIHEPAGDVAVDIVFVHGLGGGSRKTWSYSPDPGHFWPQTWLPADADFHDVRVNTFGYKSDWGERRQSVLNIHDFAQSLIGALKNHPGIRRGDSRIIFICHSMGGCIAKKAYILSCEDPTCESLSRRIDSIFFLGTPHRGSDMAAILEMMLTVARGRKPFVADLVPNSMSLTAINDAFRHFAPALRLWSFFETLPMKGLGVKKAVVVDQHSAVLGYANEEISPMHADHRHVCKFESTADSNYQMLRNALVTAIDLIRQALVVGAPGADLLSVKKVKGTFLAEPEDGQPPSTDIKARLGFYLGVDDSYELDLSAHQVLKQPGSCLWLTESGHLSRWRHGTGPPIFWLTGKPAAGKSVISSHVLEYLRALEQSCSFFFFKHGTAGRSTLGECFRSLAFQMSIQDNMVAQKVLELEDEGFLLDESDETNLWRKLFVDGIFRVKSIRPTFWVVDGVDECSNFQPLFTSRFLAALPRNIRLFGASRDLDAIGRGLGQLGSQVHVQTLANSDTVEDMRNFLSCRLRELGKLESDEDRNSICERVLGKANGSFLWARLVLQEFENAWTEEAMDSILSDIPPDLFQLYLRMLRSVEADARRTILAQSILSWVTLAMRPLSIDEVRCAVKLDTHQTLQNVAKAAPDLCSQLVFVDQDNRVHLIHETVREFLVSDGLDSTLGIVKKMGHARLSRLLLEYLLRDVLKQRDAASVSGPKRSGRGFRARSPIPQAPLNVSLLEYAASFFSFHVGRSTAEDDELFDSIVSFLKSDCVLFWIEHVAKTNDLGPITTTAINIRGYLGRRSKYLPPTAPDFQFVDSWVVDLIRVAAKFRPQLLTCPSSIHCLIPPLCPTESMISKTFSTGGRQTTSLGVAGLPSASWDDCLIRITFQTGQTTTVSHGVKFFAVGLSTGHICMYDHISLQVVQRLVQPDRVRLLEFSQDDIFLVSCGSKSVVVWQIRDGQRVHTFDIQATPLAVSFLGIEEILCVLQSSELIKWDLNSGYKATISWHDQSDDPDVDQGAENNSDDSAVPMQPPSAAAFMDFGDNVLLAVGYRSHPIFIWSALDLQLLGCCRPDTVLNGIRDIAFNPNPEIPALVASYKDGNFCVYDYHNMEMHFRRQGASNSLRCSSDGQSLVVGGGRGSLDVFDFDYNTNGRITLVPVYSAADPDGDIIRSVAFSHDGHRFVDIAEQQARVWAPTGLVRKRLNELGDTVDSSSVAQSMICASSMATNGGPSGLEAPEITSSLVSSASGLFILAGNSSGEVVLFSTNPVHEVGVLSKHSRGVSVISVHLCESKNLVVSADDSGHVIGVDISLVTLSRSSLAQPIPKTSVVMDRRFPSAVSAVLVDATGSRMLVCGRQAVELWELPAGTALARLDASGRIVSHTNVEEDPDFETSVHSLPPQLIGASTSTGTERRRVQHLSSPNPVSRVAFTHPTRTEWFVMVDDGVAHVYGWVDFSPQTTTGVYLDQEVDNRGINTTSEFSHASEPDPLHSVTPSHDSRGSSSFLVGTEFVIEQRHPTTAIEYTRLFKWRASIFDPSSDGSRAAPSTEPSFTNIGSGVKTLLGFSSPTTIVFLDVNLWICTASLQSRSPSLSVISQPSPLGIPPSSQDDAAGGGGGLAATRRMSSSSSSSPSSTSRASEVKRHFFALREWRAAGGDSVCALAGNTSTTPRSASRDVVFANGSSIVVVRGGLEFSESVTAPQPQDDGGGPAPHSGGRVQDRGTQGQYNWQVVSGSMHRRASNW